MINEILNAGGNFCKKNPLLAGLIGAAGGWKLTKYLAGKYADKEEVVTPEEQPASVQEK